MNPIDRSLASRHDSSPVLAWWRIENGLLGGSILVWSVLALGEGIEGASPVRLAAAALGVTVGLLIILRSTASRRGTWRTAAVALPSVAMGFVATQLAPQPERWPHVAQGLFVFGSVMAIASFVALGQSFAVLPSVRTIVTRGPYRIVRHPAYVGELLLAAACVAASPSIVTGALVLLAVPLTMLRIRAEEGLLLQTSEYATYASRVHYRLLPGVW